MRGAGTKSVGERGQCGRRACPCTRAGEAGKAGWASKQLGWGTHTHPLCVLTGKSLPAGPQFYTVFSHGGLLIVTCKLSMFD